MCCRKVTRASPIVFSLVGDRHNIGNAKESDPSLERSGSKQSGGGARFLIACGGILQGAAAEDLRQSRRTG